MQHRRWPTRVALTYLALLFLSWTIALGTDWAWGLERLVFIVGLPWSLLLVEASGTGTELALLFGTGVLNAALVYGLVWALSRFDHVTE
jgi:hypothetical protein